MPCVDELCASHCNVKALHKVGFDAAQNGVIGPSEAGKSTLIGAVRLRSVACRCKLGMSHALRRTSAFPGLRMVEQVEPVALQLGETDLRDIVGKLELGSVHHERACA